MTLHDEHSEMHVVGALLSSDEIYYSVADRIKPYFFYNPKIARTVRIIIDLHNNGESANIVTVSNHILSHPDVNNPEMWEIAEWSSTAILSAFADAFAVVEEMYVRRRYFALGTKLMDFGTITNLHKAALPLKFKVLWLLANGGTLENMAIPANFRPTGNDRTWSYLGPIANLNIFNAGILANQLFYALLSVRNNISVFLDFVLRVIQKMHHG